jgi:hypothetical protein
VRVEIALEIAHGIAAIGQKRELLVELVALGLEDLKEPACGLLVLRLDTGQARTGDRFLSRFAPVKREETRARHDFKGAGLPWRFHVAPIKAHGEWPVRDREAAPLRGTAVDEGPVFLAQRVLQPLCHREPRVAHGHRFQGLVDGEDILQEFDREAVGPERRPWRFQVEQVRGRAFRQQRGQGTKTRGRMLLTGSAPQTVRNPV